MRIEPCTVSEARRLVKQWHRHLEDVQGGLFAAKVTVDGETVGVALAGNPARVWQGTGRLAISRVALKTKHINNAASMLYGAICRAARELGYTEAWTYTLPEETGKSLKAAGFEDMGLNKGGEHDRPSRRRKPAKHPEQKRRWRRTL